MSHRYIVKALTMNANARNQDFNEFILVQFVEFRDDGFVLQMAQPLERGEGRAALGPCMIEVSEIVADSQVI